MSNERELVPAYCPCGNIVANMICTDSTRAGKEVVCPVCKKRVTVRFVGRHASAAYKR